MKRHQILTTLIIITVFLASISYGLTDPVSIGIKLKYLGIIKGDSNGEMRISKNLTREEALVILTRMMNAEEEVKRSPLIVQFRDVPSDHWASEYIAYAQTRHWTNGIGYNEFGLGQNVTKIQYVTYMLRVLNYNNIPYEESVLKGEELGLFEGLRALSDHAIITRGDAFIMMHNTLYAKPLNETTTLIHNLGLSVDIPQSDNLAKITRDYNWYFDQANTGPYADENSGPSAAVMAAKWQNQAFSLSVEDARKSIRSSGGWWSTNDIDDFFVKNSIDYSLSKYEYTNKLITTIDSGHLVMICGDMSYINYTGQTEDRIGRFYEFDGGHFVILKGYRYINDQLYFEVYDSYNYNSQYKNREPMGKDRLYNARQLEQAILNWWHYYYVIYNSY